MVAQQCLYSLYNSVNTDCFLLYKSIFYGFKITNIIK
jgi:hypothetical protein